MNGQTRTSRLLFPPLLALLFCAAGTAAAAAQQSTVEPRVINWKDAEFGPPGTGTRGPNARTSQLGLDPDNDGPSYFARFPPGAHFDLHWHTYAEYVAVLSGRGSITLGDETHPLRPGAYIVIPPRLNHAWDVPLGNEELVILVMRRGPADFNYVNP